MAQDISNGT